MGAAAAIFLFQELVSNIAMVPPHKQLSRAHSRGMVLESRAGQVPGVSKNDLRIPKDEGAWVHRPCGEDRHRQELDILLGQST